MALFEGKSTTERNKMIAAAVLGLVALIALYLAFGRTLFGTSTATSAKGSPTPKASVSPGAIRDDRPLPTLNEQDFVYQTTPVDYRPGNSYAPDPGRNIFAFYEPPPPTPYSPTPIPLITPKPATPEPTPPIIITLVNPQAIYAGSPGFRLEVSGERFTADSHIYFNQSELPTIFINEQKLVADIPPNLIAQEGPRQIIVQTPDGRAYSNQMMWTVQAPPRPAYQYIGMIGRKRYNNDTAYFNENGKPTPFGARLNDVVGGRFRLVDISAVEVVFEDVNLGFRHRVPITKALAASGQPGRPGFPNDSGFSPYDPGNIPRGDLPGIPGNVPRYVPPQPQPKKTPDKNEDVDDNDDGDGGGGY
ncbi:MAG: IPT/TIG domain-containing protein [Pyrinomonadaceae bacterium]